MATQPSSMASQASTSTTSTAYLPPSLAFLIANFQSFITIKLDSSNYFAWKTQVENALKATSLFHFVDGSRPTPPPCLVDASGVQTPNTEFASWTTVDRMLLSCLIATLTPSILPHVVGSDHTCQLWIISRVLYRNWLLLVHKWRMKNLCFIHLMA